MKRLIRSIKRLYYKLWDTNGNLDRHRIYGKFYVRYPDGKRSQPFSWRVANEYKERFGGEVIDNF